MTFQWSDYLAVAHHLVGSGGESGIDEAYHRAAISRAYYAALLTARTLLRDQWGIDVPSTAEIHTFIPRWLLSEDDIESQEIGLLLDRLRDRRRKADYEDSLPNAALLAQRSLADAKSVIDYLTTF